MPTTSKRRRNAANWPRRQQPGFSRMERRLIQACLSTLPMRAPFGLPAPLRCTAWLQCMAGDDRRSFPWGAKRDATSIHHVDEGHLRAVVPRTRGPTQWLRCGICSLRICPQWCRQTGNSIPPAFQPTFLRGQDLEVRFFIHQPQTSAWSKAFHEVFRFHDNLQTATTLNFRHRTVCDDLSIE